MKILDATCPIGYLDGVDATAEHAGQIADEIGAQGPFITGMDGLVAAVCREVGAPVVSADRGVTHEETKTVVDIETYRE